MQLQEKLLTSPAGLTLNEQQTNAVLALQEWWDVVKRIPPNLLEKSEKFIGLRGIPGSGKSTCIWTFIEKVASENRWAIALAAPTHDAKGVLIQMAIENGMSGCAITTIASLLGTKARLDDDGEDEFVFVRSKLKIDSFDLVILDESSMLNETQWEYIKKIPNCPPIIAMGDIEQLRPVKHRTKSPVFSEVAEWLTLTEPMRSGGNIRRLVAKVEASRHFVNPNEFADGKSVIILPNYEWIDSLAQEITDNVEVRSLVFTNKLTNWLNTNLHIEVSLRRQGLSAHRSLFPFPVETGDISTSRRVFGWLVPEIPEYSVGMQLVITKTISEWDRMAHDRVPIVHTGTVVEIEQVNRHIERGFSCSSLLIEWDDTDDEGDIVPRSHIIFVLDESEKKLFAETLEEMRQEALKYSNPNNPYRKQIFRERAQLRDSFAIVSRTYASTIHKAQGKGFDSVYVHLGDIMKCPDTDVVKELIYTAYSRAKRKLVICM